MWCPAGALREQIMTCATGPGDGSKQSSLRLQSNLAGIIIWNIPLDSLGAAISGLYKDKRLAPARYCVQNCSGLSGVILTVRRAMQANRCHGCKYVCLNNDRVETLSR